MPPLSRPTLPTKKIEAVCAVIVTWHAELALLDAAVQAVLPQVGGLVIVNHGNQEPGFDAWTAQIQGAHYLHHPDNPGLAAGFNRGIEYARAHGFEFVLLLDQDSIIATNMVSTLWNAYHTLSAHASIAAVGPQFIDRRSGIPSPFVRFGFFCNRKQMGGPGQQIACDFLISSGSLIPLAVLEQVGMMDEALFIDNIDMDWCMRASAQGYTLYGICDARMHHAIGTRLQPSRWHFGGRIIHPPARLYYFTRNRIWLYRRPHVPWKWITQDIPRLLAKFIWMSLLTPPRRANARAMLRGGWHGICGPKNKR